MSNVLSIKRFKASDYSYQGYGMYQLIGVSQDIDGVLTKDPEQGVKLVNDYFISRDLKEERAAIKHYICSVVDRVIEIKNTYSDLANELATHLIGVIGKESFPDFNKINYDLSFINDQNIADNLFKLIHDCLTIKFIEPYLLGEKRLNTLYDLIESEN